MVKDENCIFCKIVRNEISSNKVAESDSFIAILDAKPNADGHTLIISKQHWVTLLDIPNKYGDELIEFSKKIAGIILESKKGDGFNIIMNNLECAGQIVKHAHIHIIPRKEGDGLRILH